MNTNNNLQTAIENITANAQAIDTLRASSAGSDMATAAQSLLTKKFGISETEAVQIVTDIKSGMDSYKSTHSAMTANREATLKDSLAKAVDGMNDAERINYLASMLSAIELASASAGVSKDAINSKLDANMAKSETELTDAIIAALDTLPLDVVSEAAVSLDADTISQVASAIDKNSDEFRFMAALQLYIAQREGTFKPVENGEPLSPALIGSLASGAVDAMLATADLKTGKINLAKWQEILKYILGTLFAIAATSLATLGMILLTLPLMAAVWSVLGTGFLATLLLFIIMIPVLHFAAGKTVDVVFYLLDKLAPIYDTIVVKATAFVKDIYAKISAWANAHIGNRTNATADDKQREAEQQTNPQSVPQTVIDTNIPAMA